MMRNRIPDTYVTIFAMRLKQNILNFIEMFVQTFYINRLEMQLGMSLDRSEAIIYLKELLSQCNDLSPESVSFDTPINSKKTIGLQVHIKGTIFESDKHWVREVAKKHSLSVQEDLDGVIIYRPKI
jgi:hypothetical protein